MGEQFLLNSSFENMKVLAILLLATLALAEPDEAGPKADPKADPYLYYSNYYGNYYGHLGGYYGGYYGYPYHGYYHTYGKRSAEEEAGPNAQRPAVLYSYHYPHTTYHYPYTYGYPYTHYAAPVAYAKPYTYYANSGGAVHIVKKREAEGEAESYWRGYYGHPYRYYGGWGRPYGYYGYYG